MKFIKLNDRRGFLLGEYTLKIVIGAMCLLLLVYLLFSIYSSYTNERNIEKAKATMESLNEKMIFVKTNGKSSLPLLEPKDWRLISYIDGEKPKSCTKNCICLCDYTSAVRNAPGIGELLTDSQTEKCNLLGVCKDFSEGMNKFDIKLRNEIEIDFNQGSFTITPKIISDTK